ncbi:MAG: ADP-ribosylglycohydrolase family protein [Armatimonadaceae bacterium]
MTLHNRLYGSLIAGAIGDALGAPVEGWHWREIREKHGKMTELLPFDAGYAKGRGHVTDDSYLRHLLAWTIVKKQGRITPDEWGETFLHELNTDRLWTNEKLTHWKMRERMNPWWETGRGNVPSGCASMAISPVGLINATDPRQAYQDAFCIASVNQDGNNRDFAATFAAGIAAAFLPDAHEDAVIEAMFAHSDYLTRRALTLTMDLARKTGNPDLFVEAFYESKLADWSWPQANWTPEKHFSGNSIDFLSATVGLLHLCAGEPVQTLIEGASFGRDCDTIASCCGCVQGILYGAEAYPVEWRETVEAANTDIFTEMFQDPAKNFHWMAEQLGTALRAKRDKDRTSLNQLDASLAQ